MPPHAASGPPGLDLSRTLASVPLVACLCACPSSPPPPTIGGDETSGSSESTDAATTVAATTTASTSSTANGISADESGSSTDATSATWGSSSGGPEALTANDDELFVLQGGQLVLPASSGLLSNDVEGSGGPPSVVAADAVSVAGGTPIVGADGALTYLPPAGFWGRDAFDYTIADSATEVTASVTVFVAPVSFGAGELDGESGGYVIEGVWGQTMAPLRDVNGDDLADVVVGAPGFSANGSFSGRCYVVFGKPDFASIDVVGLFADSAGYVLNGEYQYARACASVSTTDDLDGDGLDELIVGSTLEGGSQAGRTYVAFGKADASPVELSAVTQGSGGFRFDGEAPGSYSGRSVANIGDANGDGVADIAIGASSGSFDGAFTGRVYVVFGDVTLADRPLSEIGSGIGGFVADGPMLSGFFGWRVGAAGDVNADGLQDIFVTNMVGAGFVIFGKADTDEVDVGYFASIGGGFNIYGAGSEEPVTMSGAGDVNGDGADDLLIGATVGADVRVYLVYGKADSNNVLLDSVQAGEGGYALDVDLADGASTSVSLSSLGDIGGDGFDDVIVGLPGANRSYIVYGRANADAPAPGTALVDVTDGAGGFTVQGANAGDALGTFVGGGGDVDGDGVADLVIGDATRAYVVLGVPTTAR